MIRQDYPKAIFFAACDDGRGNVGDVYHDRKAAARMADSLDRGCSCGSKHRIVAYELKRDEP